MTAADLKFTIDSFPFTDSAWLVLCPLGDTFGKTCTLYKIGIRTNSILSEVERVRVCGGIVKAYNSKSGPSIMVSGEVWSFATSKVLCIRATPAGYEIETASSLYLICPHL